MSIFLIKAAQLILALAILIIIHEFGHFLFARIFGVKVEKFYIFFDPWTEIFKWKPRKYVGGFGKQKELKGGEPKSRFWGNTEYGIGWIPLGGYCKISGMIDESMDTDQMAKPAQPDEFRSKPAWQRLLIMIAGVLFNFLLAILIYAGIVYATGEKYVPVSEAKMGMVYSGEARKAGFRNGDIPLAADGHKLYKPGEAFTRIASAKVVTVLRGNDTVDIKLPSDFLFRLDEEAKSDTASIMLMQYRIPTKIIQIAPGEGASKGGMKAGDRVLAVDSIPAETLDRFLAILPDKASQTVNLTVVRETSANASPDTLQLSVPVNENAKIGVGLEVDPSKFFKADEISYSLLAALPRGVQMGTERLSTYASSMKMVFTKEGAKSIGGFGSIGSIFPEKWDWIAFWNIAAFLSVALAFMNFLPIPALDGGHIMFLLYEVITRRQPSQKFLEYAQMVGMTLLILLLLYANGMDIVRFFMK